MIGKIVPVLYIVSSPFLCSTSSSCPNFGTLIFNSCVLTTTGSYFSSW